MRALSFIRKEWVPCKTLKHFSANYGDLNTEISQRVTFYGCLIKMNQIEPPNRNPDGAQHSCFFLTGTEGSGKQMGCGGGTVPVTKVPSSFPRIQ